MVTIRRATKCARCQEWMLPGTVASRFLGGLWHPVCAVAYRQRRQEMLVSR